jgi:2-keto-4-pentenoate hydratase/2-oxohepta-3-ene-1,7-dioic acid hydratase in catechol pathway
MKYTCFEYKNEKKWGVLENGHVRAMESSPFEHTILTDKVYPLQKVKLLAPCQSSKVICIGLNFKDHAKELNLNLPSTPVLFLKPNTSIVGPEQPIVWPKLAKRVDYEAELAVVIKKEAKNIKPKEADSYILGYTCANDVTARDLQDPKGQWTVAKSFDTFCPVGPVISSDIDPTNLKIVGRLNGKVVQSSNTNNFIFDIPYLVSYISQIMTLYPQDIILTGTPSGIGPMEINDTFEIEIENIGTLKNSLVKEWI